MATWNWQQHSFRAMNTNIFVWLYSQGEHATTAIEALFRHQEQRLSRFDAASDLTALNRCPHTTCPVSPDLYAALEAALWAATATGGLYDPTILTDLERAGYDRSFERIVARASFQWTVSPDQVDAPGVTHRRPFDYRSVELVPDRRAVRRPAGLGIDLGGMGKGWTVDRAADRLHGRGPFLVNAGGDLYAEGLPGDTRGWALTLEHPLHPDRWMASLHLTDGALATSTVTKRRWQKDGKAHHHLIDPRTGRPADTDSLSVSVVARRTMLAEIFAKVALLLGAEDGMAYLASLPDVEGLIYTADQRIIYTEGFAALLDDVAVEGVNHHPVQVTQ